MHTAGDLVLYHKAKLAHPVQ